MKKLLTVLCIAALAIALTACDSDPAPEENGNGSGGNGAVANVPAPGAAASIDFTRFFTVEEALKINENITSADVNLIQFQPPPAANPRALISTTHGDIAVVLFPDHAPLAVENFITHARSGYFEGMSFYRVIDNFLIQSGAPEHGRAVSVFTDEYGAPAFFESEFSLDLWNFRGALVMANASTPTVLRPHSNTSEFFIVQADHVGADVLEMMREAGVPEVVIEKYAEVGGIPGFDWRHTVFGMVIDGMDVVDEIAGGITNAMHTPYDPVIIMSVSIQG